jgi:fluoroacetyl-CoA thioesterase
MIRLMEIAAFHALHPFCDEGELNVGTHINIEHRAATGIGAEVLATAQLESFDGRFYSFRVTAHDGKQEIGRGTVGRAVIKLAQFMAKMKGGGKL